MPDTLLQSRMRTTEPTGSSEGPPPPTPIWQQPDIVMPAAMVAIVALWWIVGRVRRRG